MRLAKFMVYEYIGRADSFFEGGGLKEKRGKFLSQNSNLMISNNLYRGCLTKILLIKAL
jgi:hypothetical protein